ncbi:LysE family transporter [Streptomyces sp. ISL-66]|uniref:LysE/ArgO family amino acid transporter n=1 Tax=Streptomyces sp. ISL-66 TaxID=2819186 RepID=UPI001BEB9741|nr:LysE family transporter [Streptomyces sp. ISL-66]MBT2472167.1 LysE family transporter [Streptomyces sp. ISL-66]
MTHGIIPAALTGFGTGLSLIVAIGAQNAFVLRQGVRRQSVLAVVAICAVSDAALIALGVAGVGAFVTAWPPALTLVGLVGGAFLICYGVLAARRVLRPTPGAALQAGDTATGTAADPDTTPSGATTAASSMTATTTATATATTTARNSSTATASATTATAAQAPATGRTATGHTAARRAATRRAVLTCLAMTWLNPHVYLDTVLLLGSLAADRGDLRWAFGAGACLASLIWFGALGYGARLLSGLLARPSAWRVLDGLVAATMVTMGCLLLARA